MGRPKEVYDFITDLDANPVNWIEVDDWRCDSIIHKCVERSVDKARGQLSLEGADRRRRAIALHIGDPRFPADWGKPKGKMWITGTADNPSLSPVPAISGKSLAVWEFSGFCATATFDSLRYYEKYDGAMRAFTPVVRKPPIAGPWLKAGRTDNYSTLWWRPVGLEGLLDE